MQPHLTQFQFYYNLFILYLKKTTLYNTLIILDYFELLARQKYHK